MHHETLASWGSTQKHNGQYKKGNVRSCIVDIESFGPLKALYNTPLTDIYIPIESTSVGNFWQCTNDLGLYAHLFSILTVARY